MEEQAHEREKYTFFWKADSSFSQWHSSYFSVDGIEYNCAEQYMMHQKAKLFGDEEVAAAVMAETSPRAQKALGRKVKNFVEDVWEQNAVDIVKKGNYAKFMQNEVLQKVMLKTQGTILVEASPLDKIWGIGLAADNPKAYDKTKWKGRNLLGYALTDVRETIVKELGGT